MVSQFCRMIPLTIDNPTGLSTKYYRGDEVNFTIGVTDRHSGEKYKCCNVTKWMDIDFN